MIKQDKTSAYPYVIGANHVIKQVNIDSRLDPPKYCPYCHDAAKNPVRDEKGHWTWDCKEGCNP